MSAARPLPDQESRLSRLQSQCMASWPVATRCLEVLSELLLTPRRRPGLAAAFDDAVQHWEQFELRSSALSPGDLPTLFELAQQHHVVMRTFGVLLQEMSESGNHAGAEWALGALKRERARIQHALSVLHEVMHALDEEGCRAVVIKSLDHWPDLGSDLDLFTTAHPDKVFDAMTRRLKACPAPRSWGDHIARKWGFYVPGLPEMIEVHVGRLGQMGELVDLGAVLPLRSSVIYCNGASFAVPSPEDRVLLATLQRMYRHFYLRLCDIANTAHLLESGTMDFEVLRTTAQAAGIWPGTASYLMVASGYVRVYAGTDFELPEAVRSAARCNVEQLSFRRGFLRIPILPQAAGLFARELATLSSQRRLGSVMRLGMLPGLAAMAALSRSVTGSDKGVW